jgi:L-arabinonolactonase
MSNVEARLIEIIDVQDELGEGVLWRASDSTVWWVDILGQSVHCLFWPSLELRTYGLPERPGSLAFVEGRDDVLVVALETGFAVWAPETGDVKWLSRPAGLGNGVRMNDGRVGPDGRFWAGSMAEHGVKPGELAPGALYRLDHDGAASPVMADIHISNGICWSPDGKRMYFADTPRGEIFSAAFDALRGAPARWQPFAKVAGEGPDGAVTDADGNYWIAMWGGSRVAGFSPDGRELASIAVDAPQPSCPVLGGPEGNLLFVTTAQQGMDGVALGKSPNSGNLFVYETSLKASPTWRLKLSASQLAR